MNQYLASCDKYIRIYHLMSIVFFSITLLQNHRYIKRYWSSLVKVLQQKYMWTNLQV